MSWDLTPVSEALRAWQQNPGKNSRRLFHGRGGCFDGLDALTLDAYEGLLVATLYKDPGIQTRAALAILLNQLPGSDQLAVAIQDRYQSGAPVEWIRQGGSDFHATWEGLRFGLQLGSAQNIGYFLDMEPGRQWLNTYAHGKRVLNLFAYTCALSVVALAAGAQLVVNVDMSSTALARGRQNHRMNGQDLGQVKFLAENILKSWGRIKRAGPYDVIVIDPPSFQKGSFVATKDYLKVLRRLPELLPAGGDILACLNAPELDSQFLLDLFSEHCPQASWQGRLNPSPDFPDIDPERALKLHHFSVGAHHSVIEA